MRTWIGVVMFLGLGACAGSDGAEAGTPMCEAESASRVIGFRLEAPAGEVIPESTSLSDPKTVAMAGVATDVSVVAGDKPALRLSLERADESVWGLVVEPVDTLGSWQAALDAVVGKRVTLRVGYRMGHNLEQSSGFVLSDAEGIVAAAEAGPWVTALQAADLPSLEVTLGRDSCVVDHRCGPLTRSALIFHADRDVSVDRTTDGTLTLAGQAYVARNSGGARLLEWKCSDFELTSTWAVWRKGAD